MGEPALSWSSSGAVSGRSPEGDARSADPPGASARRYHIGISGVLYVLTTAFLGIGAFNSQNNLLYAAFGLAIAGLIMSGLIGGAGLMALRVERLPIDHAEAGQLVPVRYRVRHVGRVMPAFAIAIRELPPLPGEPEWRRRLTEPHGFLAHLGPGETLIVEAPGWARRRGPAMLRGVEISSRFPFGLARKSIRFDQPEKILVRPARVTLAGPALDRLVGPGVHGARTTPRVGHAEEFIGIREYKPGDSVRRIAWRASARTGELLVRQHAAPVPSRLRVVLDLGETDPDSVESERAVALAAALIRRTAREGIAPGLTVRGEGRHIAPSLSPGVVARMIDAIAEAGLRGQDIGDGAAAPTPGPAREREPIIVVRADREKRIDGSALGAIDAGDLDLLVTPGTELPESLIAGARS